MHAVFLDEESKKVRHKDGFSIGTTELERKFSKQTHKNGPACRHQNLKYAAVKAKMVTDYNELEEEEVIDLARQRWSRSHGGQRTQVGARWHKGIPQAKNQKCERTWLQTRRSSVASLSSGTTSRVLSKMRLGRQRCVG